MVAGPSKRPDRNRQSQKPRVDAPCRIYAVRETEGSTPVNVKLLLPPRQSRRISQRIRPSRQAGINWKIKVKTEGASLQR